MSDEKTAEACAEKASQKSAANIDADRIARELERARLRLADFRSAARLVADRLDRAADAKAAALITGGASSAASTVYELRAVAAELRQIAEAASLEAEQRGDE